MSTTQEAEPDAAIVPPATPLAVPPPTRRRKKGKTLPRLDHCLNCGGPTGEQDNFCPNCGQENEDETVPLRPLVADVLSEVASWDSKLVRTALPLLFRPGFLTCEYLAGRRIRYLSPLKMYLVISAIFFLILPISHFDRDMQVDSDGVSLHPAASRNAKIGHKPVSAGSIVIGGDEVSLAALPKTVAAYDARQRVSHHRDEFWKALILRQVIKARRNKQTFAQSVIQGLLTDLPKMMFALLPLFALLLKITYWRRRRLYIEHLIFALHSHAFAFALLTLAVLTSARWAATETVAWTAFFVILPVYLYAAMRRVYGQGWWKTGFKFFWLTFHYVVLLGVAFTLTAVVACLLA